MNNHKRDEQAAREKFWDLIKDFRTAMLTTLDDGVLRSRPMNGYQDAFSGSLWFFTKASSHKSFEIERQRQVNLSYSDPANERYISVSGEAALVRDRVKFKELWNPFVEAWFPKGLDDPDLALIEVSVDQAEYWDGPASTIAQAWHLTKAHLTGEKPEFGENRKISAQDE